MTSHKSSEVTGLLSAWSDGDTQAPERLTAVGYDELRRIAKRYMRNERGRPHSPGHRARQ